MEKDTSTTRIYLDACFDIFHHGHANILRQAKELGYVVVAGVHSDEVVTKNKGKPVYNEQDRYEIVRSIRWVDEVVEDAPFSTTIEILDQLNCDLLGHGDDVSISAITGLDCGHGVKAENRFKELKRTRGVSTTNLIDRILHRVTGNHLHLNDLNQSLVTTQLLAQFSLYGQPQPGQTVVYVAGAFDLLHVGHIRYLKQVKEHGEYLIVGLHTDPDVKAYQGDSPIMMLQERALCLLACKYVDEVVLGVGVTVNGDLLESLKVDIVCCDINDDTNQNDAYQEARSRGILREVAPTDKTTTRSIVQKVERDLEGAKERNVRKAKLMEAGKSTNQTVTN